MKALTRKNETRVYQVVENEFPVHPDFIWVECPENCTTQWTYNNDKTFTAPEVKTKDTDAKISELRMAVNYILDKQANKKNYQNSIDVVSYKESSSNKFKQDANEFIIWRDSVWSYAMEEFEKIRNNTRTVPTIDNFISELPAINWGG